MSSRSVITLVLSQRHSGRGIERRPVAGTQRINHDGDENPDKYRRPERENEVRGQIFERNNRFHVQASSTQVDKNNKEQENNQQTQHLEIRDQSIELGR